MTRFALALVCIAIPATAAAEDHWSHTEDHQSASASSVRVIEPDGYQVTLNGRTDQAPAVFTVPNADNYLVMIVRAPSGASWERKIEVRQWKQNVVRIRHVVDAPAAQPTKALTYVGTIANTTHLCKKQSDRHDLRIEFVLGPDIVKTVDVAVRSRVDVELPGGDYRLRRYIRNGDAWQLSGTQPKTIKSDTWTVHYRCD